MIKMKERKKEACHFPFNKIVLYNTNRQFTINNYN